MCDRSRSRIVLGIALLLLAVAATPGWAAPRARLTSETGARDGAGRLAIAVGAGNGHQHACFVEVDGSVQCWGHYTDGQLGRVISGANFADRLKPGPVQGLPGPAVAVSTGAFHSCALLASGQVFCWGNNTFGQLGSATFGGETPVAVSTLVDAVAITSGFSHTCALRSYGAIVCWGLNSNGQLGTQDAVNSKFPISVIGIDDAIGISAGSFFTCALRASGTLRCWGSNAAGQLGNGGASAPVGTAVDVVSVSRAVVLSAGYEHACVVIVDGTARCWGKGDKGQLGQGATVNSNVAVSVTGLSSAVSIAAGAQHTCAIRTDGTARCWGANSSGQVGDNTIAPTRLTPVAVSGLSNVLAIETGAFSTCALLADARVQCWGGNADGQLGLDTTTSSLVPATVVGARVTIGARGLTAGSSHTCAVRGDGTVACWGSNNRGQIGDGTTGNGNVLNRLAPTPVAGLNGVAAIAAGDRHTCALRVDGTVRCWGGNDSGQLGDGTAQDRPSPVSPGIGTIVGIAAGSRVTCALRSDGRVLCWGTQSSFASATPGLVSGVVDATAIAVGGGHACAVVVTGGVQCWGSGGSGQLGDGTMTIQATPVFAAGVSGAVLVSAGTFFTCASTVGPATGAMPMCWGLNAQGQLGIGSTVFNSGVPIALDIFPGDIGIIATGGTHACALLQTGTAQCWGRNNEGQLGDGGTLTRSAPVPSQGTSLARLVAGDNHTCAGRADGAVLCWGSNVSGQLGDNTLVNRTTAVEVPSFRFNIDPEVTLASPGRVAVVTVVAACDEGAQLHARVRVTQGDADGEGVAQGKCTGFVERYEVTVPAHGRKSFSEGAAIADAEAIVRDHGALVDEESWTREVTLTLGPRR